ncbi:MAG: hypothetical protein WDM86_13560 [Rhizomicrobium sp.]
MAARANPLFDIAPAAAPAGDPSPPSTNALARLAHIHADAVETARLANLLGRSLYAPVALAAMATASLALGGGASLSQTVAWTILMAVGLLAMLRAYAFAIRQPFERSALHAFAQDMSACLLYAGFAWGAGAFLALPASASGGAALLFAAAPVIAIAVLLRERQAVLLFLAPVAGLTSLACVVRPFAGGALAASLVLMACTAIAIAMQLVARARETRAGTVLPHGLIAS